MYINLISTANADYSHSVLFLFYFAEITKTKVTPRNRQDWRCHFCYTDCKTEAVWDAHTLKCAKAKGEKESFCAPRLGVSMLRQENRI